MKKPVQIAKPLPPVEFPNGSVHRLVAFDATAYRILAEGLKTTNATVRDLKGLELVRRCVPTATEADLSSLSLTTAAAILGLCSGQFDAASRAGLDAAIAT